MSEVEYPSEVKSLIFSLEKSPMVLKNEEELGEYRKRYTDIKKQYGDEYKYLEDKINSLKYGKEAIDSATEEVLKNTFGVYLELRAYPKSPDA